MKRFWGPLLGLLAGFLLAGALFWAARPPRGTPITLLPPPTPLPVVVDVGGAVAHPGVYALPPGSRVQDALESAGGLLPEADAQTLNLAAPLEDGSRLWVPTRPPVVTSIPAEIATPSAQRAISIGASPETSLVNINTASQAELESLPGIGPSLAQRIIAYRQENGPFAAIEDIQKVSGIGPATFERLRDLITVAP
ncbi:MAG: ComEA family DNA-binding protein [Anaerolineae bacterium]|nr:MAG: ComEA family DNA-binding protein [Anaerolineae bacterium]